MKYAGQRKVSKDIEKKVKREKANKKSNEKKAKIKKMQYYAKIMSKNK